MASACMEVFLTHHFLDFMVIQSISNRTLTLCEQGKSSNLEIEIQADSLSTTERSRLGIIYEVSLQFDPRHNSIMC